MTVSSEIKISKHGYLSNCYHVREVVDCMSVYSQKKMSRVSAWKCLVSDWNQTDMSDSNKLVEIPLFPLPLVLFPGATLPLQIFEFR